MDPKKVEEQLKRIQKLYTELGEKNPFRGADPSKIASSVNETKKLADALEGAQSKADNLNQTFSDLQSQLQATIREIAKAPTPIKQMQSGFKAVLTQVKKLTYEEEGIDKLNIKQLKNIQKITQARISDSSKAAELIAKEGGFLLSNGKLMDSFILKRKTMTDAQRAAVGFLQGEDKTIQSINDKVKKRIGQEKNLNKAIGLGGAALKGVEGALKGLGLGGLSGQLGLDEANEKMREVAESITDGGNKTANFTGKTKILKAGFSSMKGSVIKNLKDPLSIALFVATEFFAALKASDKATGELAKSMNMSYNEASSMRNELQSSANLSGNILINSKGLQESLMAINAELGTNVMLNTENLKTYTLLREASGLTMEDQKGIVALTNATKGNAEDITKEFLGAARASATKNKSVLNEKTLLKDIGKISAATTLSLGKDSGLIGKTLATVKALGMEMSQVEGIASSLLSFESSIGAELEAELLTGKQLNLEKARQFALDNNLAGVAEEISKQVGSAAEFGKMNYLQAESLAKAVGMNKEELAKTLFIQEQIANVSNPEEVALRKQEINKLQAEGLSNEQISARLGEKSFEDLKNQASVQERLNKSVEKLREVFISIAGPVMQIISPIIDLLIPAIAGIAFILTPVFGIFQGIADIINSIIDPTKSLGETLADMGPVTAGIAVALTAAGIAVVGSLVPGLIRAGIAALAQLPAYLSIAIAAVTTASATTLGIGAIAIAAGIAGVIAAMNSARVGDVNSPADGKTMVSTKEGGLFELSSNDDLVAFPGASKMANNASNGDVGVVNNTSSGGINIEPLVTRMAAVENVLIQILQKETGIYLDSNKIGKTMQLSNSRMG